MTLTEALAAAGHVAVVTLDRRGLITQVNAGVELLVGRTAEQLLGALAGEVLWHRPDGTQLQVDVTRTALPDGGELLIGVDRTAEHQARLAADRAADRLRIVFEASPVPTAVTRLDGRFVLVNDALLRTLGWARDEVLGRTVYELGVWADPDRRAELLVRLQAGQPVYASEQQLGRRDGTVVPVITSLELLELDGEPSLVELFYDISSRVVAEERLRASRAQLRAFVENLPSVAALVDRDGSLLLTNAAGLRYFQRSPEGLLGRPLAEIVPPAHATHIAAAHEQVLREKRSVVEEVVVPHPDGTTRWLLTQSFPVVEEGAVSAVGILATDITTAKRLEGEAKLAEARLRLLLESTGDGVFGVDLEGRCTFVNTAAAQLLGSAPESALGVSVHDLLQHSRADGSFYAADESPFAVSVRTGQRVVAEDELLWRADGTGLPVRLTCSPMSVNGEITGAVLSFSDVTERRSLESQLREASASAEASTRLKSEFLATVSHEIRTPMNAVIGMIGLLLDTSLSEEQREYAVTVRRSAGALLNLLNDILDLSKIEAGRMELEDEDFDPADVVEDVVELLATEARRKGIELVAAVSVATPALVRGDSSRLRQVLLNLVSNAVKFTDVGEVVITASPGDGPHAPLAFTVRDTGTGIPQEAKPFLFEAFRQANVTTTRRYGGSGLGLAISRELVLLMGGRITVESTVGVGSTFRCTVPFSPPWSTPVSASLPLAGRRLAVEQRSDSVRQALEWQLQRWGAVLAPEPVAELVLTEDRIQDRPQVLYTAGETVPGRNLLRPARRQTLLRAVLAALDAPELEDAPPTPPAAVELALRVLVADDNPTNQRLLALLLEKAGCRVDAVADGQEAVEAATAVGYDAILLDGEMPRLDGYEAAQAIRRAEPAGRRIPILAVTASATAADADRARAAGMDAHIAKPIDRDLLLHVLRDLTGHGASDRTAHGERRREERNGAQPYDVRLVAQLRELDSSGEALKSLVDLYCRDAVPRLEVLEELVRAGDAEGVRLAVHRCRGSAATFGAEIVMDLAKAIESAAQETRLPGSGQLQQLRDRTLELVGCLQRLTRPPSPAASGRRER